MIGFPIPPTLDPAEHYNRLQQQANALREAALADQREAMTHKTDIDLMKGIAEAEAEARTGEKVPTQAIAKRITDIIGDDITNAISVMNDAFDAIQQLTGIAVKESTQVSDNATNPGRIGALYDASTRMTYYTNRLRTLIAEVETSI